MIGSEREVNNEGDDMPPHFFVQDSWANALEYTEELDRIVRSWIESGSKGELYRYQKNSASFYKVKTTQKWMILSPQTYGLLPL